MMMRMSRVHSTSRWMMAKAVAVQGHDRQAARLNDEQFAGVGLAFCRPG